PDEDEDRTADDDLGREVAAQAPDETGDREEPAEAQRVEHRDHGADRLPHAAPQRAEVHLPAQAQELCNHSSPSPERRPPTSSTKRSSRLAPPRTSSTVPAARTRPAASTATWSHMRSTRSMTCEETTTVPPVPT